MIKNYSEMLNKSTGLMRVYEVLVKDCVKWGVACLPYFDAKNAIQMGTGFSFSKGTTLDDVFEELERVNLISVVDSFNGQKYVLPRRLEVSNDSR